MLTNGRTFLLVIIVGIIIGGVIFSDIWVNKTQKEIQEQKKVQEIKIFNPALLKWEEAISNAPWSRRDAHSSLVFQDKIWLFGGVEGIENFDGNYGELSHKSDVWVSENGRDWQLVKENAPWGERRSLGMVVFKDKIWLMGGWTKKFGETKNDVWYSEDGINWVQITFSAPWAPREGHSVVVFNDKIWLMGGVNFYKREVKNDVWYSEDGINWIEVTSSAAWSPRYDQTVVSFKNKLWLIGGLFRGKNKDDIWASENGKDWELMTDNPPWPGRHGHTSVIFKDKIWIIGRFNSPDQGGGNNDVWFSEDGINWQKTEIDPPWFGREDHAAVVFQDKIWVLGGMTIDWVWQNDIWYSK